MIVSRQVFLDYIRSLDENAIISLLHSSPYLLPSFPYFQKHWRGSVTDIKYLTDQEAILNLLLTDHKAFNYLNYRPATLLLHVLKGMIVKKIKDMYEFAYVISLVTDTMTTVVWNDIIDIIRSKLGDDALYNIFYARHHITSKHIPNTMYWNNITTVIIDKLVATKDIKRFDTVNESLVKFVESTDIGLYLIQQIPQVITAYYQNVQASRQVQQAILSSNKPEYIRYIVNPDEDLMVQYIKSSCRKAIYNVSHMTINILKAHMSKFPTSNIYDKASSKAHFNKWFDQQTLIKLYREHILPQPLELKQQKDNIKQLMYKDIVKLPISPEYYPLLIENKVDYSLTL